MKQLDASFYLHHVYVINGGVNIVCWCISDATDRRRAVNFHLITGCILCHSLRACTTPSIATAVLWKMIAFTMPDVRNV